ncbi:unnamed protein product [marine sediment metagenome]|uniref:Uncharacterized protein n=1 Tax=marine sediment metagenome TaxID=412755 RepID=X0SMD1_9ZZZZ
MRLWCRYHSRKSIANRLRSETRQIQEFGAGEDEELKQLLGLLPPEPEEQGRLEL